MNKILMQWIGETKEDRNHLAFALLGVLLCSGLLLLELQYRVKYIWELSTPLLVTIILIKINKHKVKEE